MQLLASILSNLAGSHVSHAVGSVGFDGKPLGHRVHPRPVVFEAHVGLVARDVEFEFVFVTSCRFQHNGDPAVNRAEALIGNVKVAPVAGGEASFRADVWREGAGGAWCRVRIAPGRGRGVSGRISDGWAAHAPLRGEN